MGLRHGAADGRPDFGQVDKWVLAWRHRKPKFPARSSTEGMHTKSKTGGYVELQFTSSDMEETRSRLTVGADFGASIEE